VTEGREEEREEGGEGERGEGGRLTGEGERFLERERSGC